MLDRELSAVRADTHISQKAQNDSRADVFRLRTNVCVIDTRGSS